MEIGNTSAGNRPALKPITRLFPNPVVGLPHHLDRLFRDFFYDIGGRLDTIHQADALPGPVGQPFQVAGHVGVRGDG